MKAINRSKALAFIALMLAATTTFAAPYCAVVSFGSVSILIGIPSYKLLELKAHA